MEAATSSHAMGANISTAAYRPSLSGTGLAAVIVAGLLPSLFMIVRSSRRRRAGTVDME